MAAKRARLSTATSLIPASDSSTPGSAITGSALPEADTRGVFPFLKLPPEIRNRIYDLIFIYQESANIFYAKNGFEFFYTRPFLEFLEAIGADRRKLLTKLRYNYSSGTPFVVLRYLKSCTNLQVLEVFVHVVMPGRKNSWWAYPLEDAKSFFLGSSKLVKFGDVCKLGKAESASEEPSQAKVAGAKAGLVQSLAKVKGEQNGQYSR